MHERIVRVKGVSYMREKGEWKVWVIFGGGALAYFVFYFVVAVIILSALVSLSK
jgi:hypothetical protein